MSDKDAWMEICIPLAFEALGLAGAWLPLVYMSPRTFSRGSRGLRPATARLQYRTQVAVALDADIDMLSVTFRR